MNMWRNLMQRQWVGTVVASLVVASTGVAQAASGPGEANDDELANKGHQAYLRTMTRTYNSVVGGPGNVPDGADVVSSGSDVNAEPVIIAIVGEAFDASPTATGHPDLQAKVPLPALAPIKVIADTIPSDPGEVAKATAMAGIAAAATDNTIGIAGVCRNCQLLSVRADMTSAASIRAGIEAAVTRIKSVHNHDGSADGSPDHTANGVILLATKDLPVASGIPNDVNADGSTNPDGAALKQLLLNIYNQNPANSITANTAITVVVPAGNGFLLASGSEARMPTDVPTYPCASAVSADVDPADGSETAPAKKLTVCVGSVDTATRSLGQRSVFSNFGPHVDVSAPGEGIVATLPYTNDDNTTNDYGVGYSTHASAAIVAGMAARLHAILSGTTATLPNTPASVHAFLRADNYFPEELNLASLTVPESDRTFPLPHIKDATAAKDAAGQLEAYGGASGGGGGGAAAVAAPPPPRGGTGPVAKIDSPKKNHLLVTTPTAGPLMSTVQLRGTALGQTATGQNATLELLRHDCSGFVCSASGGRIGTYNSNGTVLLTRPFTPTPSMGVPNSVLGKVCYDRILIGTTNCPLSGSAGYAWSNGLEEGVYTLRLTVTATVSGQTKSQITSVKFYVDRSFDPQFNNGMPVSIPATLPHGPHLADAGSAATWANPDGILDLVFASSDTRKVYVYSNAGVKLLESNPVGGPIVASPVVGNVDGGADQEIVATVNAAGVPSLLVFKLPYTFPIASSIAGQLGAIRSSAALTRVRLPDGTEDDRDSIFVTTVDNRLHWYRMVTGVGLVRQGQPAMLTAAPGSVGADLCNPITPCPTDTAAYCGRGLPLMESTPLIGMMNTDTPRRIFVASQDAPSFWGFKPTLDLANPANSSLTKLPGLPLALSLFGNQPGPGGGIMDIATAYFDNTGALQIVGPQYVRDTRAACSTNPATCRDTSRLFHYQIKGATSATAVCNEIKQQKKNVNWLRDAIFPDPLDVAQHDEDPDPLATMPCPLKADGSLNWNCPGLDELFMYAGVASGDLRRGDNGSYESVVIGASGRVYAFDSDMNLLPGWKRPGETGYIEQNYLGQQMGGKGTGVPLIVDIDQDADNGGLVEVIATSSDGLIYAWDSNGNLKRTMNALNGSATGRFGFPRSLGSNACWTPYPAESPLRNWTRENILRCASPAVADLGNDTQSNLELVAVQGEGDVALTKLGVWDILNTGQSKGPALMETAEATDLAGIPDGMGDWNQGRRASILGNQANVGLVGGKVKSPSTGNPVGNAPVVARWYPTQYRVCNDTYTNCKAVYPEIDQLFFNEPICSYVAMAQPVPPPPAPQQVRCKPVVGYTTTDNTNTSKKGDYKFPFINPGKQPATGQPEMKYTLKAYVPGTLPTSSPAPWFWTVDVGDSPWNAELFNCPSGSLSCGATGSSSASAGGDVLLGFCGDGACNNSETLASCPTDCKCGNGVCDSAAPYNETYSTCPGDCKCGNNVCDSAAPYYETCSTCSDCGACSGSSSSGGGDGGCCGGCFLAGTPITMADGTLKPIEQVKVGDRLLAFDEATGELKPDAVTETFVHPDQRGYLLINGHLHVTPNHPVYFKGQWVEIGTLKVGDELLGANGQPEPITSIEHVDEVVTTYNVEVNPYHTYIAGEVVVHNKPCTPCSY